MDNFDCMIDICNHYLFKPNYIDMKNSLLFMLGISVCMLSCKKQNIENETRADSTVNPDTFDSANVAPATPSNSPTDTAAYRTGPDTLQQSKKHNDSITR